MSVYAEGSMSAHVVVLGNEKGGSGKSTTAMHVAVALMAMGQRVATVDLDSRQRTLTRYIENRCAWAARSGVELTIPSHICVARGATLRLDQNEAIEFDGLIEAAAGIESSHDIIVIDTPGTDAYLMRLAHAMADTLITPLNDSFVDFDVLGTVDPASFSVTGESHYAEMVRDARRKRRGADGGQMDWIVARNRLATIASRNKERVGAGLMHLAARLGFRCIDGLAERLVYREFFPRGLTALDPIDEETLGVRPSLAHVTAREEVMALIAALKLPLDERGKRRAAARAEWAVAQNKPLEIDDIVESEHR
jgi:chromosome partitioning protein